MGILNIQPATRAGAHLLISLYGPPEGGKTMTALKLARGLVGEAGKIGFLDTESGRGRLYADAIKGGYDYAELTPPFTPERYVQAIREFEDAGYPVLIIDSFSHVWQGEGGVLDQADKSGSQGLQKWLKPKLAYKKLVNALLSTRMHIIFCSRAKQPMEEVIENGKKTLRPGEWREIQDKNMRYEMTVVLEMQKQGAFALRKCPGPLLPAFHGETIGEDTGRKVAQWVAGGDPIDHAAERLKRQAVEAAEGGVESFRAFWGKLDMAQRAIINPGRENYASIAKAADEERERLEAERRASNVNLDDPFADIGAAPTIGHVGGDPDDDVLADLLNELVKITSSRALMAWQAGIGDREKRLNEMDRAKLRAEIARAKSELREVA